MLLSESLESPGVVYYLPKTIVQLEIASYGRVAILEEDGKEREVLEDVQELRLETVTPLEVADISRSYSLHYEGSVTSHDRVCIGVSEKGLLQSVEGAADDKTGDIIISVAKLAGRLMGPGAFAKAKLAESEFKKLRSLKVEIDPLQRQHWRQVDQAMIRTFGGMARSYRFRVEDIDKIARDATAPDICPDNSVCYRSRVPVRFTLGTGEGRYFAPTSSVYKDVVNRRVTGHIDVTRALMVEKITKLTFKDGVLIAANIKKPSEGLAVAKLPLTVVDAVMTSALAAPGDFLSKFTGLAGPAGTELIKTSADNAAQIKALQTTLKDIREADLSVSNDGVAAADAFQLKCTTPGPQPKI